MKPGGISDESAGRRYPKAGKAEARLDSSLFGLAKASKTWRATTARSPAGATGRPEPNRRDGRLLRNAHSEGRQGLVLRRPG
jgi:hypothetical protein